MGGAPDFTAIGVREGIMLIGYPSEVLLECGSGCGYVRPTAWDMRI